MRDVGGEEGGSGSEGCEEVEPGLGGEEMGRGVGVKGVVFVSDGVVGILIVGGGFGWALMASRRGDVVGRLVDNFLFERGVDGFFGEHGRTFSRLVRHGPHKNRIFRGVFYHLMTCITGIQVHRLWNRGSSLDSLEDLIFFIQNMDALCKCVVLLLKTLDALFEVIDSCDNLVAKGFQDTLDFLDVLSDGGLRC